MCINPGPHISFNLENVWHPIWPHHFVWCFQQGKEQRDDANVSGSSTTYAHCLTMSSHTLAYYLNVYYPWLNSSVLDVSICERELCDDANVSGSSTTYAHCLTMSSHTLAYYLNVYYPWLNSSVLDVSICERELHSNIYKATIVWKNMAKNESGRNHIKVPQKYHTITFNMNSSDYLSWLPTDCIQSYGGHMSI